MENSVNIDGTDGVSLTKVLPGTFDHYHTRRELIIQRNASKSPEQRERITLLMAQLDTYEWAEPKHRTALVPMILRQMSLL